MSDFRDCFRDDSSSFPPAPPRQVTQLHLWVVTEERPFGQYWVKCALDGLEAEAVAPSKLAGISKALSVIAAGVNR